jgi:gliding motility-associated-like protein
VPISINVIDNPVADFSVSPNVFVNDNVIITNLSSGANLYNWNFGDGNSLITYSYNINHSYSSSGRYCILLTAIDTVFLCSDTVTKCINVEDNFMIEIPNIFTPNLDGVNDEFKVRAKGVKEFHCEIYDRWGIKLYEWDDVSKGWNGYLKNNSKAPTGTYYYIIKCVLNNGEIKEFKGYLTLLE